MQIGKLTWKQASWINVVLRKIGFSAHDSQLSTWLYIRSMQWNDFDFAEVRFQDAAGTSVKRLMQATCVTELCWKRFDYLEKNYLEIILSAFIF